MKSHLFSSSLLAALFLSSAALAAAAPQGDAARGKAAYERVGCYTCHGWEGQGVPGRKLAPGPLPYPAFSAFVRTTSGNMPPYTEKVLPEQDLTDIHAFLRAIPASPAPTSIPLLQAIGN